MGEKTLLSLIGAAAGGINGLLGAGGGMVLVPMLGKPTGLKDSQCFPASIAIIAPICVVSLLFSGNWQLTVRDVLPYLLGSTIGGIAAGLWGKYIPVLWLHRILGILILWGGFHYLC